MSSWDVVIAGAGPAGAASANFLAQAGHKVLVLEADEFPRFHIGESLLPLGLDILEKLKIPLPEKVFRFKRGARFIDEENDKSLEISFEEAYPGPPRYAYQVDRAGFDALLRDRCREAGAEVLHGKRVKSVDFADEQVKIHSQSDTYTGRYFIDATGQERLLGKRNRSVTPYKEFGIAAAYQHFSEVDTEIMSEDGDIRIMMRPEGWAWVIPLPDKKLSIGVITQKKGASTELITDYVKNSPLISSWTRGAKASEPRLVGNYAFKNTQSRGSRYVCVGDSACFLDPVFSSGVSLALLGALKVSEILSPALKEGKEAEDDLMKPIQHHMESGYSTFAALIYRFYNTKMVSNIFLGAPSDQHHFREGIVSLLAGDVWRDENPFKTMLHAARRTRAATETFGPSH